MNSPTLLDTLWILVCAVMVFAMQPGFMCLEAGLSRKKNNINVALKNIADFGVSVSLFWVFGYALMFGGSWQGFVGIDKFLFSSEDSGDHTFFVFQAMFVATSASIISGAIAERTRFYSYLIITAMTAGLIYPIVGHWIWGGLSNSGGSGWLRQLGFHDFAGSTVVHSVGGWIALAAAIIIGPRLGRFESKMGLRRFNGGNIPLSALGILILWAGWFGFNGGSNGTLDRAVPVILINTFLAGAAGLMTSTFIGLIRVGKPEPSYILSGPLAGLVAITASCNIVTQVDAILIGAIGGACSAFGKELLERIRVDDVVDAIPVHLFAGIWGTLAVAIFGESERFTGGVSAQSQFGIQLFGVAVVGVSVFGFAYFSLLLINRLYPLRVSAVVEDIGLNIAEHNASTDHWELVKIMRKQAESENLGLRAPQDPFTDAGQIGFHFNQLLYNLERSGSEIKKWRSRVLSEIKLAMEVQQHLLPQFNVDTFPIYALNKPAREISGDFYDVYPASDSKIFFALGDVSGKGIHAGMVMAQATSLFRAFATLELAPCEILSLMNAQLSSTSSRGMFVTAMVGVFDPPTGHVVFSNAGHLPLVFRTSAGIYTRFPAKTYPLGISHNLHGTDFPTEILNLSNGSLYIFSDGLIEAKMDGTQEIGISGLESLIDKHISLDRKARIKQIFSILEENTIDDMTMMVLQY